MTPPFYALAVWPADIAVSTGLATDADARVLGNDGKPIPGLYACGNDMASVMAGSYPGPGTTLGPAIVFAYRAAMHAKSRYSVLASASIRSISSFEGKISWGVSRAKLHSLPAVVEALAAPPLSAFPKKAPKSLSRRSIRSVVRRPQSQRAGAARIPAATPISSNAIFASMRRSKPPSPKPSERFGGLHVLHNNAGGSSPEDGPVTDVSEDEFWRVIKLDLYGTFLCSKLGIPHMIKSGGGSIINMSSIVALRALPGRDCYTAAKGAVAALTRSMAVEYAPDKIRVNAIAPGVVLTERVKKLLEGRRTSRSWPRPICTGSACRSTWPTWLSTWLPTRRRSPLVRSCRSTVARRSDDRPRLPILGSVCRGIS